MEIERIFWRIINITLYYRRHVNLEQIRQVLQAHSEGSCL